VILWEWCLGHRLENRYRGEWELGELGSHSRGACWGRGRGSLVVAMPVLGSALGVYCHGGRMGGVSPCLRGRRLRFRRHLMCALCTSVFYSF
jgi:hypothetical protein